MIFNKKLKTQINDLQESLDKASIQIESLNFKGAMLDGMLTEAINVLIENFEGTQEEWKEYLFKKACGTVSDKLNNELDK